MKKKAISRVLGTLLAVCTVLGNGSMFVYAEETNTVISEEENQAAENEMTWDFEDCEAGTVLPEGFDLILGGGKIAEVDGNKVLELEGGSYPNVFIGDAFSGDLDFQARFKIAQAVDRGGVGLHIREQGIDGKQGYATCFEVRGENEAWLEVRKRVGQTMDPRKSIDLTLEDPMDWHTLRMVMEGTDVKVYLDGELKLEQELTGFEKGKVGLWSYLNTVYFDDVTLKTTGTMIKDPEIDKTKIVLSENNRDEAQFSIKLNGNLLQQITMENEVLKEGEDYTVTIDEDLGKVMFLDSFLNNLETEKAYKLNFEFENTIIEAEIYILSEEESVDPINWEELTTDLVEGTEDLQTFIQYIDKYIVNKWWDEKKNFDAQEGKEYLVLGGTGEHTIRPLAHQARTLAASIKLNIYDESIANVPKAEAEEKAVLLIRSLAKNHKANTSAGWGNEWQSAFWAADVGQAGWMLWDEFSALDQEYIRAMVEYEANRFIGYDVPFYKDREGNDISAGDSKSEENSWNADLLMLAAVMMPNHENQEIWMSKAVELMLSAFSVPEDCTSEEIVNGFKLGKIMDGYNMESDGMVINHGFVHPDYLSTIYQNLITSVTCALGGEETPKAATHNADIVYEAFVNYDLEKYGKPGEHIYVRDENGNATFELVYPQGTDWGTDRQINFYLLDVLAAGFGFDEECDIKGEDWAQARMPEMLRMQRRGSNGDLGSLTGEYYRDGDQDTYASREEWVSYHAISAYMALWAFENDLVNITDENHSNIKSENFTSVTLVAPESIQIGKSEETEIKPNEEIPYLDSSFAEITYTSSHPEIIEISEDGILTAHSEGVADITVTVDFDGVQHSDTITITAYEEPAFDLLVYEEDFEEGSIPEEFEILNGNWTVEQENGNRILRQTGDKGGLFIGDAFDGNFALETKVRFVDDKATYSGTGVYFRDQGTEKDGYSVNIGQRSNSSNLGIELRERSTEGGIVNSVFKAGEIARNVWHTLRVQVMGNNVKVFLDGEQVLENNYDTYAEGKIGLWSYKEKADFDEIKVFRNSNEYEEISTSVLEYVIGLAEGANTDGVVDAVKENFVQAFQNAKDVLARVQAGDSTVTQNEVDDAWRNLLKAMQYLEFKKGDKTDLEKVITLADEMNNNLDVYLDEGKDAFTEALTEAKEVYADGNAMQDEVDTAWRSLLNAIAELRLKPNKGLLEDLITKADSLNETDYETESFAVMRAALAAAKAVFENENASQEEVDAAVTALEDAIAKLTPISTGDDGQQGGSAEDNSQNGAENGGQDQTGGSSDQSSSSSLTEKTLSFNASETKAAKTGDAAKALPFATAAMAAVLAAGGVVVLNKRREKN